MLKSYLKFSFLVLALTLMVSGVLAVDYSISSLDTTGVIFTAPTKGLYQFTITGGAYTHSIYWDPIIWETNVWVYINKPVQWGNPDQYGQHLINYDWNFGGPSSTSRDEAEALGIGKNTLINLNQGEYVILIIEDGSDYYSDNEGSVFVNVGEYIPSPTVAEFTASPTEGFAPLTVQFTDFSTGEDITSRVWQYKLSSDTSWITFNPDSTLTYNFSNAGLYDIKLTVTGMGGSDDEIKITYINVQNQPIIATFGYSPQHPTVINTITFTPDIVDTNGKYNYLWQSSDGSTSSTRVFSHQFKRIGYYYVNLTVSDPTNPLLTGKTEQKIMVVCGGKESKPVIVSLGTKVVQINGNTICRQEPYKTESGEVLQVCKRNDTNTGAQIMFMAYNGPISGNPTVVGHCAYSVGSNLMFYTYANNNKNPDEDCFLSTKWISKDYEKDDDAKVGSPYYPDGDRLLDWTVSTLSLSTYELRVVVSHYNYNCGCSGPLPVCNVFDTRTWNLVCTGKNAIPECSSKKAYVCDPPEGSKVGEDKLMSLEILAI
ncbi:MAG: PKD domain-containing protein [Methanomicrobiales archaeon]|nr:PKD domain-containing protein [Methanomicrobiales archaeon]